MFEDSLSGGSWYATEEKWKHISLLMLLLAVTRATTGRQVFRI
jgi:hypothetical protein